MKTEQEQLYEMINMLEKLEKGVYCCDNCYGCCGDGKIEITCPNVVFNFIQALTEAGYGNVSEYKAEIERLKKETTDTQKGTAKEILQTLYDECYEINDESGESMGDFVSDDDILHLAKHYGVEVDV